MGARHTPETPASSARLAGHAAAAAALSTTWACCDRCGKWRRVPSEVGDEWWECAMLGGLGGHFGCSVAQEPLDEEEEETEEEFIKAAKVAALAEAVETHLLLSMLLI